MKDDPVETTLTVKQLRDALGCFGKENDKVFFINIASNASIEETYKICMLTLGEYGEVILLGQKTRGHLVLSPYRTSETSRK